MTLATTTTTTTTTEKPASGKDGISHTLTVAGRQAGKQATIYLSSYLVCPTTSNYAFYTAVELCSY